MNAAILGKKIGMTSIFTEDGLQIPCTVILAGPCPVTQVKTMDNDGYAAVQIGYDEVSEKALNKPEMGHLKKAGVSPMRTLKEFRGLEKELNIGDQLTVEQFTIGDKVRVSGTGKGRGFQGVVKRHHFRGVGMATHGQSDRQRHPGSIGSSSYPSRVYKGIRMAGQMGNKRVSVRNIEVVDVMPDKNILFVKGGIPGCNNSLVEIIKL
ncbi:MAG: 50S ribosomal protein L3 [Candidatus Kapabacteria bacterium]|jgi:large subunit ribosomal protein L3|nr:50S ribosomal protein L3 [Candidatus Kapabacteria bacterium]